MGEASILLYDGRKQKSRDEGRCAGAPARCPPGVSSGGNGSEPVAAGRFQLGEPEEVHSPADIHGP